MPAGHDGHADQGGSHYRAAVPPHVPIIEFDPADLSPQSEVQPDLVFRRPGARRDLGLVFLTGNDIALDPAPTGAPVIRGGRKEGTRVPESPAEAEDFTWIADVGKLDPAAGVMNPLCTVPGTDAGERVVARMSLRGGTISAQLLGLDSEDHVPIRFDFVDATAKANTFTDYSQALAAGVAYDLVVLSEEITLVLTPYGGDSRKLVFSFVGIPTGGTIEVLIKNMPLEGVLGVADTINPGKRAAVDSHFTMYYALSANPPQTPWIPYSNKARFGGPICPGARFTG